MNLMELERAALYDRQRVLKDMVPDVRSCFDFVVCVIMCGGEKGGMFFVSVHLPHSHTLSHRSQPREPRRFCKCRWRASWMRRTSCSSSGLAVIPTALRNWCRQRRGRKS